MKKNIAERCVDLFVQVRWRRRGSNRRTDTTPDCPDSLKLGYECSGNIFGRMPMKIKKIKSQKKNNENGYSLGCFGFISLFPWRQTINISFAPS